MKTCSNCGDAFIETHHCHKFCSEECRAAKSKELNSAWRKSHAASLLQNKKDWVRNNKPKVYGYTAKTYLAGKLPPWMYS
jgi:protein-arginine kinase activator protein McsA